MCRFQNEESAQNAIKKMNGVQLCEDGELIVKLAHITLHKQNNYKLKKKKQVTENPTYNTWRYIPYTTSKDWSAPNNVPFIQYYPIIAPYQYQYHSYHNQMHTSFDENVEGYQNMNNLVYQMNEFNLESDSEMK